MIVRTKTPYALWFPPSIPSILSTFTIMVTTRSITPVVFGFFVGFFPFLLCSGFIVRYVWLIVPLVYDVSATLTV